MCYGQVVGEALRKARKAHVCHWCGNPIAPGTEYRRWAYIDMGSPLEVKVHQDCERKWQDAAAEYGGDLCISPGEGVEFEDGE